MIYQPNHIDTAGYLSPENKRKFTIRAGILGAAFFLAQFIIPFLLMMAVMPFMAYSMFKMRTFDPQRGAYFDNALWYVEEALEEIDTIHDPPKLKKIVLNDMEMPKDVENISVKDPWLLAGEDRLWIIGSSTAGWYGYDGLTIFDTLPIGDICRPFLYRNQPTVIQSKPEGLSMLVLKDQRWESICPVELNTKEHVEDLHKNLQILPEEEMLHLFLNHGDTLYHNIGCYDVPQVKGEWQVVCRCNDSWQAAWIDNKPAVFVLRSVDYKEGIVGLRLSESEWNIFFSKEISMVGRMGVYSLMYSDKYFVFFSLFRGRLDYSRLKEQLSLIVGDMVVVSHFPAVFSCLCSSLME